MNQCLICSNKIKDSQYKTLCTGCYALMSLPEFQCSHCGIELQSDEKTCGTCLINPPSYSAVGYACEYKEPINHWVMSLKFGKNILITRLFAETLMPQLQTIAKNYQLMPVPLHKSRLRKRGYNQAYEIAKELAKLSKRKLNLSLKRTRNTAMQAELKLKQRANNVKNAFTVIAEVKNKNLILIDDVMTSGNTLAECAKTLIKAGANDIKVLVFARKSLL